MTSDSADKIVAEVRNANAKLRCEYERKEAVALDKFINDMRKIAKYACKLTRTRSNRNDLSTAGLGERKNASDL